jgi:spore coat polysaccharide biosynthesis protein SpsF
MITHLLDRLKLSRRADDIIICTSPLEQDAPLVDLAAQEGINSYQGDPDDVLLRMTKAAEHYGADTVVSCTADNPFVDPDYIDKLVDFHLAHGYDYSKTEGLPFGTFSYVLSYPAMLRACAIKVEHDTEVWGGYFTETGQFSWGVLHVEDPDIRWPELRLTVDTPEDFAFVSAIFDELYRPDHVFSLHTIVDLCRRRPDLVAINAGVQQKQAKPIRLKNPDHRDAYDA